APHPAREGAPLTTPRSPRVKVARVFVLALLTAALCACGGKRGPKQLPPPTPNPTLYEGGVALIAQRKFEAARKVLTEIGTRESVTPALDAQVKVAIADSYFYQSGLE